MDPMDEGAFCRLFVTVTDGRDAARVAERELPAAVEAARAELHALTAGVLKSYT